MKKWNTKIILITFISFTLLACGGGESEESEDINTDIRTEVSPTAFTKNKPNEVEEYDFSIFEQPGFWVANRVYTVNSGQLQGNQRIEGNNDSLLTADKLVVQVALIDQQEFGMFLPGSSDHYITIDDVFYYENPEWCMDGLLTSRYYQNQNSIIRETSCDQEIIYSIGLSRLTESIEESFGSISLTVDGQEDLTEHVTLSLFIEKTINLETLESWQSIEFSYKYNYDEEPPFIDQHIVIVDNPISHIKIEQPNINHAYSIIDSTNNIRFTQGTELSGYSPSRDNFGGEFMVWNDSKVQGSLSFNHTRYFETTVITPEYGFAVQSRQEETERLLEFDFDLSPIVTD